MSFFLLEFWSKKILFNGKVEEEIGSYGLQSVHNSHTVQKVESDFVLKDVYFENVSSTSI
jgi:hypothetical protein